MPRAGVLIAAVCLTLCAGCGNSRTPVPSISTPVLGGPLRGFHFPAAGVSFAAPRGWSVFAQPPALTVLASGGAVVSVWRYPLSGRTPSTAPRLAAARDALIAAARRRDASLRVLGTRLSELDGSPSIELDAIERIAGQSREVRSTHVYTRGGEIVLDEYAPVSEFPEVDASVFSPLNRSLAISAAA